MDSSSSGSLQSSSGGGGGGGVGTTGGSHEEEYTSNANHDQILSPFSPLINTSSSTQYHHYPFSNSLDHHHHHHAFSLNPNPSLPRSSLNSPWPPPPSSSTHLLPPNCTNTDTTTTQLLNPVPSPALMHPPPVQPDNTAAPPPAAQRGAKKRSRASRRPPTTVLTTDTSNFRAMVQEFTGFPAAPFVPSSSPFVRPRIGSGLGLGGIFQSGGSNSSPYNNLLRPFPQKLNPSVTPSNLSSSSIVDAIASIARSGNFGTNLNSMFGPSTNATSTSSSGSNTASFVNASNNSGNNASAAVGATNSNNNNSAAAADPISSFANLHSNVNKYGFGAQAGADLDGLVGSNGYERDKSLRFGNSEFDTAQAMEKGVFGFLNYADLKDKR